MDLGFSFALSCFREGGGGCRKYERVIRVRNMGGAQYIVGVYITLASARSFAALSRALVFDADVLVPVTPFAYFGKCQTHK
jgi:hypothetical protein